MKQNKWAGNVEGMGERRDACKILVGSSELKGSQLEDLDADGS